MSDPRQIEPSLVNTTNVTESFFGASIFDGRFVSSDYHSYKTVNSVEIDPLSFSLPALKVLSYTIFMFLLFYFDSSFYIGQMNRINQLKCKCCKTENIEIVNDDTLYSLVQCIV